MYRTASLKKYCDDVSAKMPAPGGGSVAAYAGCLGAGLLSMVIRYTVGKQQYSAYEKELQAVLVKTEKLRRRLLELTDEDVRAFTSRDVRRAIKVPYEVCRLCQQAIVLCPVVMRKGNINLISDVAVAAALLESAFASAVVNVDINLKRVKNPARVAAIRKALDTLSAVVRKIRVQTEAEVGTLIRR